jgi:hypothetical protein
VLNNRYTDLSRIAGEWLHLGGLVICSRDAFETVFHVKGNTHQECSRKRVSTGDWRKLYNE